MEISELEQFLNSLRTDFSVTTIGQSVLGKNLYSVSKIVDKDLPYVLVVAGMHAREHLACDLVCKLIEDCTRENLNYNICFVPLINPDGVQLCKQDVDGLDEEISQKLVEINRGNNFSLYKANANGVDLNNNWPANWEQRFSNKTFPSSQGFYGYKPLSEPENVALKKLTEKLKPKLVISFHLKGEEIYFDFFQDKNRYKRDRKVAKIFAKSTGYKIKSTEKKSSGGYKDWCVQKLKNTALTIELGKDKFDHPFPKEQLSQIYKKNIKFYENIEKSLKIIKKYEEFS